MELIEFSVRPVSGLNEGSSIFGENIDNKNYVEIKEKII